MSHVFKPDKSFIANLYWQEGGSIDASEWQASQHRVHRIGVGVDGNAPWGNEGWLFAGPDNYSTGNPNVPAYLKRVYKNRFWFGCYETAGEYQYEIRAASDERWGRGRGYFNRRLDASRNGYLGLYSTSTPVGASPQAASIRLWQLRELQAQTLTEGGVYTNIECGGLRKPALRRLYEEGYPYLNEQQGEPGRLALNVIKMAVASPE